MTFKDWWSSGAWAKYAYSSNKHVAEAIWNEAVKATAKRCAEIADEAKTAEDPTVDVSGNIRKEFNV